METVALWHPMNGKWVHIVQTTENSVRKYYTDGLLVDTKGINQDGTVKPAEAPFGR
jgi:hypothetical protein